MQELIDSVDGEIVSYDEPGVGGGSASWSYGEYEYCENDVDFREVKTNTGKNYYIRCVAYTVCKGHPEWVGVIGVELTDTDLYTAENDYPDDACHQVFYADYDPDSWSENATEQANAVVDALIKQDADAIEELFTSEIRENVSGLKDDIETWMDNVEGEIVSYDSPYVEEGASKWSRADWEYKEREMIVEYQQVEADTEKNYCIQIRTCVIFEDHPEKLGIIGLTMIDNDLYTEKKGYSDGKYEVYYEEYAFDD